MPGVIGRTFNLGSGQEIGIRDLVALIAKLTNREVAIISDEVRVRPRTSEVERLIADSRLARELLGWTPSVSLEEGLRLTIDWIAKHTEAFETGVYVI